MEHSLRETKRLTRAEAIYEGVLLCSEATQGRLERLFTKVAEPPLQWYPISSKRVEEPLWDDSH